MQRNNLKNIRNILKMSPLRFANALELPLVTLEQIEDEKAHLPLSVCYKIIFLAQSRNAKLGLIDILVKPEDRPN